MKYAYVDKYRREYAVKTLCRVLEVSRAAYYAFKKKPPVVSSQEDIALRREIVRIHTQHRWTPGAVKTWRLLNASGISCGKHRVAKLRKLEGIETARKRRARKPSMDHSVPPAPNLVKRVFSVPAPNQIWVGDMTAIRTGEGWLYLAIVLDLFARRVVGWATDSTQVVALPIAALDMALRRRKPAAGLIFHSDQGSAYSSKDYRDLMENHGVVASMSRKGNCLDNAVAESFFSSLKNEVIHERLFPTRSEARAVVNDYIGAYYNDMRLHQTLDYQTPAEVESRVGVLN